ncbi:hypothetical protein AKO1_015562 [Acrasis kona]|uniref:Protein-tyrosine-phosphatase n=1 Tax=Acrasis kona TaxID=1008807 RepID=A0AAW2ZG18_9EUKA
MIRLSVKCVVKRTVRPCFYSNDFLSRLRKVASDHDQNKNKVVVDSNLKKLVFTRNKESNIQLEVDGIVQKMPTLIDSQIKRRRNFSHLPVYTIDPANAIVIDDGLSIDDENVYVHIANPSAFITQDQPLLYNSIVENAYKETYLFNKIGLSCSDDKYKLVLTVVLPYSNEYIALKKSGQKICLAYIDASKITNFTYEQADIISSEHSKFSLQSVALSRLEELAEKSNPLKYIRDTKIVYKSSNTVEVMMMEAIRAMKCLPVGGKCTSPMRDQEQFLVQVKIQNYLEDKITSDCVPECMYCEYEDVSLMDWVNPAIEGLHSVWITPMVIASQRPSSHLIKEHCVVEQFKNNNIAAIINLQEPHEHPLCGHNELHEEGWSYSLKEFNDGDIDVHTVGWRDNSIPLNLDHTINIMKVIDQYTNQGKKVLVHCHAGIGRTGIICVCHLLWTKEVKNVKDAVDHFYKLRRLGPNSKQVKYIRKFYDRIQTEPEWLNK